MLRVSNQTVEGVISTIDNTYEIYKQLVLVYKNLLDKYQKGVYDPSKANIAFRRIAQLGIKDLQKSEGISPTRGLDNIVAEELREDFEGYLESGEIYSMLGMPNAKADAVNSVLSKVTGSRVVKSSNKLLFSNFTDKKLDYKSKNDFWSVESGYIVRSFKIGDVIDES